MRNKVAPALLATAAFCGPLCGFHAHAVDSRGFVRMESRAFGADGDERTNDLNLGLATRLETQHQTGESASDALTFRLQAFGRVDSADSSRAQAYLEEAWAGWIGGPSQAISLRIGAQILNWSATEAFHPADIVNSRNFDGNFENAEKIGEPMVQLGADLGFGKFTAFFLPMLIDPILAQNSNRQSFRVSGGASGISLGDPLWVRRNGTATDGYFEAQYGFQYLHRFSGLDWTVHLIEHIDRSQPLFSPEISLSGVTLRPVYLPVRQYGTTAQGAFGPWLLKLEAAYRDFLKPYGTLSQPDHGQIAVGVEYGWSHESGMDSTLIAEAQTALGLDEAARAQALLFQRDALLGYRLALNDAYGHEFFASAIFDLERSHEYFFNLSAARRLSDVWSAKAGLRWVVAPQKGPTALGLEFLDASDHAFLEISRYF